MTLLKKRRVRLWTSVSLLSIKCQHLKSTLSCELLPSSVTIVKTIFFNDQLMSFALTLLLFFRKPVMSSSQLIILEELGPLQFSCLVLILHSYPYPYPSQPIPQVYPFNSLFMSIVPYYVHCSLLSFHASPKLRRLKHTSNHKMLIWIKFSQFRENAYLLCIIMYYFEFSASQWALSQYRSSPKIIILISSFWEKYIICIKIGVFSKSQKKLCKQKY